MWLFERLLNYDRLSKIGTFWHKFYSLFFGNVSNCQVLFFKKGTIFKKRCSFYRFLVNTKNFLENNVKVGILNRVTGRNSARKRKKTAFLRQQLLISFIGVHIYYSYIHSSENLKKKNCSITYHFNNHLGSMLLCFKTSQKMYIRKSFALLSSGMEYFYENHFKMLKNEPKNVRSDHVFLRILKFKL